MDEYQIAKFQSDYDPDTVFTIIRSPDGDITLDIQGDGECRIAMSGSHLQGRRKAKVVMAFQKIIDVLNDEKKEAEFREQHKKIDMGEIYRKIGDNMSQYRHLQGLTQQELADKMGLSRFAITRYESGQWGIPLERLYEIADILGITVFDVLP